MKRGVIVLVVVAVISVLAYCLYYSCATRPLHAMMKQPEPELEWLRREFGLTDAQFAKVRQLHEAYRPGCDQMCLRIAEANAEADALIAKSQTMTPEIAAALQKCAALQADCRQALLTHVYAVGAEMSPAQAQRYITMMKARIVEPGLPHDSVISEESR